MTAVRAQLLEMLKVVASALGEELRSRLVFVGGCTTALGIGAPIVSGYALWSGDRNNAQSPLCLSNTMPPAVIVSAR